jgi:hypothetical protein
MIYYLYNSLYIKPVKIISFCYCHTTWHWYCAYFHFMEYIKPSHESSYSRYEKEFIRMWKRDWRFILSDEHSQSQSPLEEYNVLTAALLLLRITEIWVGEELDSYFNEILVEQIRKRRWESYNIVGICGEEKNICAPTGNRTLVIQLVANKFTD